MSRRSHAGVTPAYTGMLAAVLLLAAAAVAAVMSHTSALAATVTQPVQLLRVFNCETAQRTITVWTQDTGAAFVNRGTVAPQGDADGCVAKGSTPLTFSPQAGHSYTTVVTDPLNTGCTGNDPSTAACIIDSTSFTGDPHGAIRTFTVGTRIEDSPLLPDFSIAVSGPTSGTAVQGTSATAQVTLSPFNDFADTPHVAVTGLPSGVTATATPLSATTPATVTFTASASAPPGVYPLTITTDSPLTGTDKTLTYQLTVQASFSLTTDPTQETLDQGKTTGVQLLLHTNTGFIGTATLRATITGQPNGITASFSNTTVSPAGPSSVLFLTPSDTTPAVAYQVTIEATSSVGGAPATVIYTLIVTLPLCGDGGPIAGCAPSPEPQ